jgi:IclR family acetate operon transcriptional repressor
MSTPPTLALDKSLSLLSLLVPDGGASTVSALAQQAGVPVATAHRIVATFERRGYLTRFARGRYLPGPALLRLANAATFHGVLAAASRPILEALAKTTGLTAHLGVLEGDMVTYLVKAGQAGSALFTREGMQLEAYCSAVGKMLLAAQPETQRERYLSEGTFVALTPHTLTDAAALRDELDQIRARDFAHDACEIHPLLRCAAAPVRNESGAVIAALSLSALQDPEPLDPASQLAALRAAACDIEQRLFPVAHKVTQSAPADTARAS